MKLLYPIIDDHKECGNCHIIKPVSEYSSRKNPSGSYAVCTNCKKCKAEHAEKLRRSKGSKVSKRYPIINDHKKCTACNENKHISEYSFTKEGYMIAKCASCMIKYHEDLRRKLGLKKRIMNPIINGIKKCSKCCIDKPVKEYFKNKHHCIDCEYKRIRDYKNKKSDHINLRARIYYSKNKNRTKEYRKIYAKRYIAKTPDNYIKAIICRCGELSPEDIPQEVVEMKRKQLLLSRQIKQSKSL